MMLAAIPLSFVPLLLYNILALTGVNWSASVFEIGMVSGARFSMSSGDLLVALAVALLFLEILKATRTGSNSILDHLASTAVFIIYLVEFLLVPLAATATFFLAMLVSLVDVVGGYSVTIRSARRDVTLGPGGEL